MFFQPKNLERAHVRTLENLTCREDWIPFVFFSESEVLGKKIASLVTPVSTTFIFQYPSAGCPEDELPEL